MDDVGSGAGGGAAVFADDAGVGIDGGKRAGLAAGKVAVQAGGEREAPAALAGIGAGDGETLFDAGGVGEVGGDFDGAVGAVDGSPGVAAGAVLIARAPVRRGSAPLTSANSAVAAKRAR